jgi:hypothetical protein
MTISVMALQEHQQQQQKQRQRAEDTTYNPNDYYKDIGNNDDHHQHKGRLVDLINDQFCSVEESQCQSFGSTTRFVYTIINNNNQTTDTDTENYNTVQCVHGDIVTYRFNNMQFVLAQTCRTSHAKGMSNSTNNTTATDRALQSTQQQQQQQQERDFNDICTVCVDYFCTIPDDQFHFFYSDNDKINLQSFCQVTAISVNTTQAVTTGIGITVDTCGSDDNDATGTFFIETMPYFVQNSTPSFVTVTLQVHNQTCSGQFTNDDDDNNMININTIKSITIGLIVVLILIHRCYRYIKLFERLFCGNTDDETTTTNTPTPMIPGINTSTQLLPTTTITTTGYGTVAQTTITEHEE